MRRRFQPATIYLAYSAGDGFLFSVMSTVFSVFLIVRVGLNPFQLLLLGTVLEVTYLLSEIPTGIVADTVSRRLSIVIGLAGVGLGFLLLGLSRSFEIAIVSQVLYGFFAAFVTGADVAWVTDELGEAAARPIYLRSQSSANIGALAGIATSVALASIDLRLPLVVAGAGFVALAAALALVMPEEGFTRPVRKDGERLHASFVATLKEGAAQVRTPHIMLLILATAALHGASTEGFDRLVDFHLLRDIGLPSAGDLNRVVWFGILDGGALLLGVAALRHVKRNVHLEGHVAVATVLMLIDFLLIASFVTCGLMGIFWPALLAAWAVGALRSVREPVFNVWINQGLDPRTRATINSLGGQADALGQAAGGPGLGLIASRVSVPAAMVTSGLLSAPSMLLYLRAMRRGTVGTLAPDQIDEELVIEE
jgi:MFS transporter, DHA3 family, tetracycline resistance protein